MKLYIYIREKRQKSIFMNRLECLERDIKKCKNKKSIHYFYFNEYMSLINKYGKDICFFMMVGNFYELYGYKTKNDKEEEIFTTNYKQISRAVNLNIARNEAGSNFDKPQFIGFQKENGDYYIDKLIELGYTLVFYDQYKNELGEIYRSCSRVISPETYTPSETTENKHVMSIIFRETKTTYSLGYCIIDVVSGNNECGEIYNKKIDKKWVQDEIYRLYLQFAPTRVFANQTCSLIPFEYEIYSSKNNIIDSYEYHQHILQKVYPNDVEYVLDDLRLGMYPLATSALVLTIEKFMDYTIDNNTSKDFSVFSKLKFPVISNLSTNENMSLENNTIKQLSVLEDLFNTVNFTKTIGGRKLLKKRLANPFYNPEKITELHNQVEFFRSMEKKEIYKLRDILKEIANIELLNRKIEFHSIKIHELKRLYKSLELVSKFLESIGHKTNIEDIKKYQEIISHVYNFNAEGFSLINKGVNEQYDKHVNNISVCKIYFEDLVEKINLHIFSKSKNKYAIPPAKLTYESSTKKYTITVTKTGSNNMSKNFENCKIVAKGKGSRSMVFSDDIIYYNNLCEESYNFLRDAEKEIHTLVIDQLSKKENVDFINNISQIISNHDVSISNAICAGKYNFCKPRIIESESSYVSVLEIRNPVIERLVKERYVTNDIELKEEGMLLYGINSLGKSTLQKAIALNIILAQSGAWCSATSFELSPYKNMFTRVGNLDSNFHSSFEMECLDIKSIIRRSNKNTFVLLDELVASTENISAISISYAMIKRLCEVKASFVFATHLINLYDIIIKHPLDNLSIKHLSFYISDNDFIFERKLKDGPSQQMYGITISKYIIDDMDFSNTCNEICNEMMGTLTRPRKSKYNSKLVVEKCVLCNSTQNLHTHHINEQHLADEYDIVQGVSKNHLSNICVLCEKCHRLHHNTPGGIIKNGWFKKIDGTFIIK